MRLWRWPALPVVLVLLATACGDDEAVTTTSVPAATTASTAVATTTTTTTLPTPEYGAPWLWLFGGPEGMLLKVDGGTGELAATAQLGTGGLHDAIAGPGGIWAADCTGNTVYLVSTETTEVVASIPVEGCPNEVAAFAGTVLVLAQNRGAVVQIDPFGFRVVAEYYDDPYGPQADIEGAANISEVLVMGSSVLGYAAAGNLLVTISADGGVAAAAAGPGNVVMVVLQDGRVQWFDRWGNLLGRDHVQMHPYQASWENGKFCVLGWDDAGQAKILCGDPLEGEPFARQSAQVGAISAAVYGGTLYTTSSDGLLAAQTMGDPASFHELGKVDTLASGLLVTPKNPGEGGNGVGLCPELVSRIEETEESYLYQTEGWPRVLEAMREPAGVPGWSQPTHPFRPVGSDNPPVTSISLADPTEPFHQTANPLLGRSCSGAIPASLLPHLCREVEDQFLRQTAAPDFGLAVVRALSGREDMPGWGQPRDPSRPAGPDNPTQTGLGLTNPGAPWHPQVNPLSYKVCPGD